MNAKRKEVANGALMEKALDLEREVWKWGTVRYRWVPRAENAAAEKAVIELLDKI